MVDNELLVPIPRPTERISAISWNIFNPAVLSAAILTIYVHRFKQEAEIAFVGKYCLGNVLHPT